MVVDDINVYWTDRGSGSVKSVPKKGGAITTIAQGQAGPLGIGLDDTYVYWSNNLGAAIVRAPKDGSGAPQLVADVSTLADFVIVGDNIYFHGSTDSTGAVTRHRAERSKSW
jgi:hypothetical protein